jgi:hypothetical protein
MDIEEAENLMNLAFHLEKVKNRSITPLPKNLVSLQFFEWLKALHLLF